MKQLMIIVLCGLFGLSAWAQPKNYDVLMKQAKSYFEQKEYANSIDCYEKVISELRGTEYEGLIPTIRNSIAINNMYLGVAELKAKNYPDAKTYLEKAIKDAKPESKTFYMAHSWMGQWNSVQALDIRTNRGDYQQGVRFSLEAERYFDLAREPEKRLREQLTRASALQNLSRNNEAETLLKQIMAECEGLSDRGFIMGRAALELGGIELATERFQLAIQHLEKSYNLCNVDTPKEAKTWAYLAANTLCDLYSNIIPDNEKSALWKQRADELETQTLKK